MISVLGTALANAAWQGLLLVGGLALAIRLLALRRHASTVCWVWLAAFAFIVCLPAIDAFAQHTAAAPQTPAGPALGKRGLVHLALQRPDRLVVRLATDATVAIERFAPKRFAPIAVLAWSIVAAALLSRLLFGLTHVAGLKSRATAAPHLQTLIPRTARRRARVAISNEIETACAAGFWLPIILLPRVDVEALERDDLARIIAHEYGHIARYDDYVNFAIKALCALFFFFPALTLAARAIERAREESCDDIAIVATGDRSAYAQMLAFLAERAIVARRMATAPGFGASEMIARVEHALDTHSDRRAGCNARGAAFIVATFAAACILGPLGIPRFVNAATYAHFDASATSALDEHGLLPETAFAYTRADPRLSVDDIIALSDRGIEADFVERLAAHGYNTLDADKLIALREAGFEP